ncbi:MAG TPA: hypothetical protein VIY90_12170 [Steroidobacteraceae bacterium]
MLTIRPARHVRALMLLLRLNADVMNYPPLSHRGQRTARLMSKLRTMLAIPS